MRVFEADLGTFDTCSKCRRGQKYMLGQDLRKMSTFDPERQRVVRTHGLQASAKAIKPPDSSISRFD